MFFIASPWFAGSMFLCFIHYRTRVDIFPAPLTIRWKKISRLKSLLPFFYKQVLTNMKFLASIKSTLSIFLQNGIRWIHNEFLKYKQMTNITNMCPWKILRKLDLDPFKGHTLTFGRVDNLSSSVTHIDKA